MNYEDNSYRAVCLRVIDGDTVHLEVDLGLRVKRTLDIRLVGIDAPERRGEEKEAGVKAQAYLETLLFDAARVAKPLVVQFEKGKSFDRWLGRLFLVTESEGVRTRYDVQADMVQAGHAKVSP